MYSLLIYIYFSGALPHARVECMPFLCWTHVRVGLGEEDEVARHGRRRVGMPGDTGAAPPRAWSWADLGPKFDHSTASICRRPFPVFPFSGIPSSCPWMYSRAPREPRGAHSAIHAAPTCPCHVTQGNPNPCITLIMTDFPISLLDVDSAIIGLDPIRTGRRSSF